jgi:hypothetical protein
VRPEELGDLFRSFKRTAFRLETLSAYSIDTEAESLRLFREGQPEPAWRAEREWLKTVSSARAAGKLMQRVRLVRLPPSEYVRFEFAWGFPANVRAGEDIRVLVVRDEPPPGVLDHDYWLFDDATVVRLEYDQEGRFLRPVAVVDPAPYRRCRDAAMAGAMPFAQYRATVSAS